MRTALLFASAILIGLLYPASAQQPAPTPATIPAVAQPSVFPGKEWAQTTPAAAGWDVQRTAAATAYAKEIGASSFMLIQHGVVVVEYGDISARTELHSCRKSFLSALIGNAVARGQIDLDDTLEKLGIDDNPPSLTPEEKQATVRMLLQARSGVYHVAAYETAGMEEKRPVRGSHPPGSFWYYNNWDFNTLGGFYAKAVGRSVYGAWPTRSARRSACRTSAPKTATTCASRSRATLHTQCSMSARDFARFALLYLHGGNWEGRQVVPAQWVAESTHPWSDTESGGYGYLWWTGDSATPGHRPVYVFPPGSFWLEGHLGQYAVVVPSRDLIVVVRVEGDRPSKTVSKREMARLVRMVFEATKP